MKTWVEVSGERLAANYSALADAAGAGTTVLAVIKANAYGHGAEVCAPLLATAGVPWLGVTDAAEGIAVRHALAAAGIAPDRQPRILVMCGLLPEDADAIVHHALTPVVWDQRQMEWLAEAVARSSHTPLPIHLEIDTGMARQGIVPGEKLQSLLRWLTTQQSLRLDGVMTHFASAEVACSPQTLDQRSRFEQALHAVAATGLQPAWVHAGNSSTIDNDGADHTIPWLQALAHNLGARAMVRSGLGLYGYCLPIEHSRQHNGVTCDSQPRVQPGLQPVMTWKTRIISLRDIQPGDAVGYNGIFIAQRPMRLALLPAGYADGLRRELSASTANPGGWVILHGQRAPIVGRISMNLTTVDVTGIPNTEAGDEAVLLGDGITAEHHAQLSGTIAYEILCGIRAFSRLVDTAPAV